FGRPTFLQPLRQGANAEAVPISCCGPGNLVEQITVGQLFQRWPRTAISGSLPHSPLFSLHQPCDLRGRRTESQLAIEPERAGIDGLRVLVSDLVGVHRETRDA